MIDERSEDQARAAVRAAIALCAALKACEELRGGDRFGFGDRGLSEQAAGLIERSAVALAIEPVAAHRL